MDERMIAEDEVVAASEGTEPSEPVDPLATEESPLAAPPQVPPPPVPVPDPEPIPLDDPGVPVITQPDRPDLGLAEPIGDPEAPVDLPTVDPTTTPPAADPGALMQALARLDGLEASLGRRLDGLQASIERENRAEASREKVVDRLHAELQEAKQGFVLNILRPVLTDLIKLHDDMGKMADAHAAELGGEAADADPAPTDRLVRALRDYQQEVEDILYRQGVEPYREEGPAFDPRRQRGLSTVPTADASLAKTVARRLRPGFQAGDKVIRPEVVAVYAHKPA